MVAESWLAGTRRVSEPPRRIPWDMGHFAGYEKAKEQANARRRAWKQPLAPGPANSVVNPRHITPRQQAGAAGAGAGVTFDGPGELDTLLIPPDPQIAAGPTYLVVVVNSLLGIYDKKGNLQGGFQSFSSFFGGLGITGEIFDPRIIYDQADQRYIFSAGEIDFTNLTNGHVVLAVSASNDPTQIWYKYAFDSMGRNAANTQDTFPDFPGLGLSPSAVYLTTNQFELTKGCIETDTQECYFSDAWIRVVGLPGLLSGSPNLAVTTFSNLQTATGFPAFSIQPAVNYGTPGAEFMVAAQFSSYSPTTLNLFSVTTTGTPALSTTDLTVPAFNLPPYAVEAGTSNGIITDDFRPLNAVWANGSLWFAQNIGEHSAPGVLSRWYQVGISSLASASLVQSGSVSGSGDAFYPAVSVMADGTVGMAFSTSSAFQEASAAFTGRAPADPPGTMRGYADYRAGLDRYDEPEGSRWGDYSGVSEDPDGNSSWMIAEYANTPDPRFGTAVAQVSSPPALSVSPGVLDFKLVLVGQASSPQTVSVTNNGGASVTLGTITLGGTNAADFALGSDACSGTSLAANQTCTVALTFKPTVNDTEDALLSVPYAGSNLIAIGVTGFGYLQAVLSVSPAQLTFPPTVQQSASAPVVATVSNTGNIPVQLGTGFLGDTAFTETNNCGSSLAAGASCQITVTFRPTQAGLLQGGVSIGNSAQNSTTELIVSGTGVTAPAGALCPSALVFSNQAPQTTSAPQPVIFTNTGSDSLNVSRISATGDFAETDNCGAGLPPRASCTINVTFTPSATGTRSGSITVIDNAPGGPQTISLTGSGVTSAAALVGRSPWTARDAPVPLPRTYTTRPLEFERNDGQFDPAVKFVARTAGRYLAVTRNGLRIQDVTMALQHANAKANTSGSDQLPGKSSYFVGSDPRRWRTNVSTYAKIKTRNAYPDIDLVYYGNQHQLEYDFVVAPGASPKTIRLRFEGHSRLHVAESGDLVVSARDGDIRFHRPVIYQPAGDSAPGRKTIQGRYVLRTANEVGFAVGGYDKSRPLVIDPALSFSTYLAGSASETAGGIALDSAGNAYVTGTTSSPDFPITKGAFQSNCGTVAYPCNSINGVALSEAFVTKLSPSGTLIYSTYLGGSVATQGFAIAVDSSGNAYVTGMTTSQDFPVTLGAFQNQCKVSFGRCASAFVAKLNPAGSALAYSTYLGGTGGTDEGLGIGVDSPGSAWVGGLAGSTDFPTTPGALQTSGAPNVNGGHGFVTKLAPDGSSLAYSTYLGGTSVDQVNALAVDAAGNAYAAGRTNSLDFPSISALQAGSYNGNGGQAFVSKFSPTGALVYSTYLGGPAQALAAAIAVDAAGAAYVAGSTSLGQGFPLTLGTLVSTDPGGGTFVTKLHPAGCALLYSTFVPPAGPMSQEITTIAVDGAGDAFVAGDVINAGGSIPLVNNLQPPAGSFISELDPYGAAVLFSSYLGGSSNVENISGIAVDAGGDIYVAGTTNAPDFPVVSAIEPTCGSCENHYTHGTGVFVTKIGLGPSGAVTLTRPSLTFAPQPLGYSGGPEVQSVGLMNNQSVSLAVSSVTVTGNGFSSSNLAIPDPFPCTSSVAPQTGCFVQVEFAATQVGPQSGVLTIVDNGPGSPRTVRLSGQGLTNFALSNGGGPGPLAKGTDSAQFTILPSPVPGAPNPTGEIALSCSGIAPAACSFSPPTVDFAVNGQSTLTVSGLRAVSGYSFSFSVTGALNGQTYTLPLSISFQVTLGSAVSAASYAATLAPESIAAAFGSDLGTSVMGASALPLPTLLNGTTVNVTGSDGIEHASPLFYVSPVQVNFEIPAGTATGTAVITITGGDGAVNASSVNISAVAPSLFTANASGKGPAAGLAVFVNSDGANTSTPLAVWDPTSQEQVAAPIDLGPAGEQVFLSLFGTGIRGRSSLENVAATIGGAAVPVTYAGAQGTYVGLDQVNVGPVPRSLMGAGLVDIIITVDGQRANTVQVAIR
jgi:uncharacterized protein (TIGR03437 family)